MHFRILFLCVICTAVSGHFIDPDFYDEVEPKRSLPAYTACEKEEDRICVTRHTDNCTIANIRFQCPRLCGVCAPFTPKCPEEYPFGCCWNGELATDIKKSNCPKCEDISSAICHNDAVKKDCDLTKMTAMTRKGCPVTCGACHDYGFEPCEDSDPRCAKMEDTTCCESSEILQDVCKKTCGICS